MRLALLAALLLTAATSFGQRTMKPVQVYVNSELIRFDTPPLVREGRLLVPMRGVFERLGANVQYVRQSRTVMMLSPEFQARLEIGRRIARVNGENRLMDAAPIIRRGRTMVPLRFLSETLGAAVVYRPDLRTVRITTTP